MRELVLVAIALGVGACARASEPRARAAEPPRSPPAAAPAAQPAPAPASPAEAPAPRRAFLKGQTHVHTARSYDARTPPDDVLGFYAGRGYDFVAITDHNRVTVVEPPPGLLLVPGVELTQNSASCEPKPAPGYRCLFHTSALFVEPGRDPAGGERFAIPYRPGRLAAYLSQLELARSLGGIAVVNHPLFHFAADARTLVSLAEHQVRLVELFNASLDRQHPGGRDRAEARAEALWDEVLSRGVLIHALASDDAHHFADAAERRRSGKFAYEADRAWIMVRAEKSLPAIESALASGDYYASTGVLLSDLERSRERVSLRISAPAGALHVTRFVGAGGRVLAESDDPEPSYRPRGDEGYVRAVVRSQTGEKAWLQPLMLGAGGA